MRTLRHVGKDAVKELFWARMAWFGLSHSFHAASFRSQVFCTFVAGLLIKSPPSSSFRLKYYLGKACFLNLNDTDSCPYFWKVILAYLCSCCFACEFVWCLLLFCVPGWGRTRGDLNPLVTNKEEKGFTLNQDVSSLV